MRLPAMLQSASLRMWRGRLLRPRMREKVFSSNGASRRILPTAVLLMCRRCSAHFSGFNMLRVLFCCQDWHEQRLA